MEEILASIRRIIADDDHEPVRRPVVRRDDPAAEMRRPDAPRADAGRVEPARPAAARPEAARGPVAEQRMPAPPADRLRHEADRADHFGFDASRTETPRPVPVRPPETRRPEVSLGEAARPAPRPEPLRAEVLRPDPVRAEPPHSEPVRYGTQRTEAQYSNTPDAARPAPRPEPVSAEIARADVGRLDPLRSDAVRRDAARSEHGLADGQGAHLARPEALHAAVERAVAESPFSQDDRRSSGHDAEAVARYPERDEAAAQPRPVPRAENAPEVVRPTARPVAEARSARPSGMSEARRKDLLSPAVDAAVMAAFESLGDVSLGQTALPEQGRTVEDLIKEILRPMLKTWLDDHLPDIVERLVRAEIERVARNGR